MRISPVLALCAGLLLAIAAYGVRYEPPPRGRLILDAVLDSAAAGYQLPLRLPRSGRYYAEILLEAGAAPAAPVELDLTFVFHRRERVVAARTVHVSVRPEAPAQTLFWLEVPRDLPENKRLTLDITRVGAGPAAGVLRFQFTRKAELLPLPPR